MNNKLKDLLTTTPLTAPTRAGAAVRVHNATQDQPPKIDGTKPFEVALKLSWWIGTILSLVIVVAAGLKTQYLEAPTFTDALSSWFALGLFGFAVQVSTASVVEAAGRLTPSSRT